MKKLEGNVAVITGGNSGIGLAIAREFVRQGAKVAIFGRNPSTLSEAAQSLGDECYRTKSGNRLTGSRSCKSALGPCSETRLDQDATVADETLADTRRVRRNNHHNRKPGAGVFDR